MKFESKSDKILSLTEFAKRQIRYFFYSLILMIISLLIGTFGYEYFTELNFIDGFYNSSMMLSGMGEVIHMNSTSSKIFSSIYAFYCSIVFSITVVIFLTPLAHRFLHYLHIDTSGENI